MRRTNLMIIGEPRPNEILSVSHPTSTAVAYKPDDHQRVYTLQPTREAWLLRSIEWLSPAFAAIGRPLPQGIRVSVGHPLTSRADGQCFPSRDAADRRSQVFISPRIDEPVEVLAVLLHELVHVSDDCRSGHRGQFARTAKALGLVGPMTSTTASPELKASLRKLATILGTYPHAALVSSREAKPTQSTRMVKVTCPACGYLARTTRYWLDLMGPPWCPDGQQMIEALESDGATSPRRMGTEASDLSSPRRPPHEVVTL